ncbi:MAG: hypothetical protein EKK31_11835 [Hyphomicrobiales bacterium]|nr:MAG: hypothetical protein EKK31_11835 [Hyphomicrobiales bacterium]
MNTRASKIVGQLCKAIEAGSAPLEVLEDARDLIVDMASHRADGAVETDIQFELNAAVEFGDLERAERMQRIMDAHRNARLALLSIAEGNLGDAPWQAGYEKIKATARAAISA